MSSRHSFCCPSKVLYLKITKSFATFLVFIRPSVGAQGSDGRKTETAGEREPKAKSVVLGGRDHVVDQLAGDVDFESEGAVSGESFAERPPAERAGQCEVVHTGARVGRLQIQNGNRQ